MLSQLVLKIDLKLITLRKINSKKNNPSLKLQILKREREREENNFHFVLNALLLSKLR